MKNILKFNILIILAVALIFSGCKKWIDTDLNIDPDQPADVPMSLLLPSIEASSAYTIGGNTAVRTSNIWMQFFDGVDRQSLTEGRYQINSADVNDLWENCYAQSMMDCKNLIIKAEEKESPYFDGIAKVMLALNLGTLTDFYGDLPYTEAFKGAEANLSPVYDTQESIYTSIDGLLAEAIADFGAADNAVDPGSEDLIYGGDISMWTKAAYALRARYAFYKGDNVNALTYIGNSFLGDTLSRHYDKFNMAFESGSNQNPIYQFMRDRTDIRMGSTFMNMLINNADPRLPFYAATDVSGSYSGSDPGSENALASKPGIYNADEASPVLFSSYAEMKFIEAEIKLNTSPDEALTAFKFGVMASVDDVAGRDQLWLDTTILNVTVSDLDLEMIITEKYKAMYSTVIPYDDYRRTGFPVLQTVLGATAAAVPNRFPYPQSEITYNPNTPSAVPLTTKLWIFE